VDIQQQVKVVWIVIERAKHRVNLLRHRHRHRHNQL